MQYVPQQPQRPAPQIEAVADLPPQPTRNLFAAGLSAGVDQLQGLGGAAASAVGQAVGFDGLRDWGAGVAARNQQEAEANGRPDLEIAPWKDGGASFLPWLAYQATKQIPQIVPTVVAGMAAAPVVGPALAGTAVARLGAAVPQILGGGGLRAGADFATRRAALEAGKRFAGAVAGATAASYPTSVGSLYQEALERDQAGGGTATKGDAFKALVLGVPYGAMEGLQPAGIARALQEGLKGGFLSRTGKAVAASAVTEAPTEAAQTLLENTFRPDLSAAQKAERVIDAALTGAAVGGVFGAAGGIRSAKVSSPTASNEETKAAIDGPLGLPAPEAPKLLTGPQAPKLLTGPQYGGAAAQPETNRFAGLDQGALEANRGRIEQRLFEGEPSPGLTRELGAYRGEESQRSFAGMDTPGLMENLANIRARLDAGEQNTGLSMRAEAVESELARRQAREARVPEQGLLFGEQDLAQSPAPQIPLTQQPRPPAPPSPAQIAAREILSDGGRRKLSKTDEAYIGTLDATNEIELAQRVDADASRTKAANSPAMRLADRLGLTETDDQIGARLAVAERALTDARIAVTAGQADAGAQASMQRVVDQIQTQIELRDAVRQVRSPSPDGQQAPSVATPPGQQTGPTYTPEQLAMRFAAPAPAPNTEAQASLPLEIGRQSSDPAPNPQTFEQASTFLKNAVGTTSNAQIEEIGRATVPDAVARISTLIGGKRPSSQVLSRMGQYFGLVDAQNRPVDIATAIANTETEKTALDQRYAALPQVPAAMRTQMNTRSTELTERLDALRAAQQVQTIDATIYDPATPEEVRTQAREARAQITGQFPQPTIEANLRNQPFEPVQEPAVPQADPVPVEPVSPTARPAPVRPRPAPASATTSSTTKTAPASEKPASRKAAKSSPEIEPPPAPKPDPKAPPPNPEATKAVETAQPGTQPADQEVRGAVKQVESVRRSLLDRVAPVIGGDAVQAIRKAQLGMASFTHIAERMVKGVFADRTLRSLGDSKQLETTIRERIAQPYELVQSAYDKLQKSKPKSFELIPQLMKYTEMRIDPRKTWKEHTWLQGEKNPARMEKFVTEANGIYNTLRRQDTAKVYDDFAYLNRAERKMGLSEKLYRSIKAQKITENLPGFENDPMLEFIRTSATDQSAKSVAAFWDRTLERQLKSVGDYLKVDEPVATAKVPASVSALRSQYADTQQRLKELDEGVYFHLGRYGKFMFSAELRSATDDKGSPPADDAVKAFIDALEKNKFTDVQVTEGTTRRNVVIRVESQDALNNLVQMARDLERRGVIKKGTTLYGLRDKPNVNSELTSEAFEQFLGALTSNISWQEMPKATQDKVRDIQLNVWLSTLPENSLSRVMTQREAVSGYSKDSIRNFAFRYNVGAAGLARMVSSRYTREALNDMQIQLNDAKRLDSPVDPVVAQNILDELNIREAGYIDPMDNSPLERLRAFSYAFYLGMSPAYVLTNLTQLGALGWPELAKKGGFVNSYKAMARATPIAFRILREVFKQGREVSLDKATEATVTDRALAAALSGSQIPADLREFIMKVVNTGMIDVGSAMRELGRVADNRVDSKTDKMLKYAGAMGYYSETFNRLVMAIAAKEIADKSDSKLDPVDYAKDVIGESMFNYQTWHIARLLGRTGLAGPVTPVVAQFSQYSFQTMEKLYREAATSFGGTAAEKKEARAFLGSHLAAVTVLAGTLGLPFASVAARAAESLVELFSDDDEPYDIKAAYRVFLANTFGKDLGEVIARGVPRALGFDISGRVGEQDLLPLTQFMTDRRKIEDIMDARASDLLGPGPDMAISMMAGLREFYKGEYIKSMQSMLPVALKGPVKAYEMSDKGYVDKTGRALPMEAGALDILYQAMGFRPSEKADYDEDRLSQVVRKGELTRQASELRADLAKAIESGNRETALEIIDKARKFDTTNPAYAVLPQIGSTITQRQRASAISAGTGTPLGTNIKDPTASTMSRGYNWQQ